MRQSEGVAARREQRELPRGEMALLAGGHGLRRRKGTWKRSREARCDSSSRKASEVCRAAGGQCTHEPVNARAKAVNARVKAVNARAKAVNARVKAVNARAKAVNARVKAVNARMKRSWVA